MSQLNESTSQPWWLSHLNIGWSWAHLSVCENPSARGWKGARNICHHQAELAESTDSTIFPEGTQAAQQIESWSWMFTEVLSPTLWHGQPASNVRTDVGLHNSLLQADWNLSLKRSKYTPTRSKFPNPSPTKYVCISTGGLCASSWQEQSHLGCFM